MKSAVLYAAPLLLVAACETTAPRLASIGDTPSSAPSDGGRGPANVESGTVPADSRANDAGAAAACGCRAPAGGVSVWRRGIGDADVLAATSVATDRHGDAFVAGPARGVVELDPSGSVVWSKPFGAMVATEDGPNIYVAGTFTGSIALDGCRLSAPGTAAYLAELDPSGDVVRCSAIDAIESDGITGLAVDVEGSAIVSGRGLGTVKLDPQGSVVWKKPLFGAVATDSRSDVVVTGALTGSATFDGNVLESAGGDDVLVAKLDPNGAYVFARRFGDAGSTQMGQGVAVDPSDNVLVSGVADGSVDFGSGAITLSGAACPSESGCKQAGFVAKVDPSGKTLWSHSLGSVRALPGIAADSRGDVLVSGAYPGNAPPYRLPLLVELDAAGNELSRPNPPEAELTDVGAGYGVAFDACGDAYWSMNAPPAPGATSRSLVTKFAP